MATTQIEIGPALKGRRMLMEWYTIKIPGKRKIEFRAEKFLTEELNEKRLDLHLQRTSDKQCIEAVIKLMMPVLPTVAKEAIQYLKENPTKKKDDGEFTMDIPKFAEIGG